MGSITFEHLVLDNVFLVDGLKHNLISISQLRDMNYEIHFNASSCKVICPKTKEIKLKGKKSRKRLSYSSRVIKDGKLFNV